MIKSNVTDKRPRREKFKREIKLISNGCAHPTAFPGGKITIYPWDSAIDAWLNEAAAKATGTATDRLLYDLMAKVCNLNGCPLEDFIVGDVNTVLMVARSVQTNCAISYLTVCDKCGNEMVDEITVPEELKPVGQKKDDYQGFDTVVLKDSTDTVDVRPLRIRDELAILGRTPEDQLRVSNHLAHCIAPVVGVNQTQAERLEELVEWYEALSPADAKQLQDFVEANTPHLSQELVQNCDRCGHTYPHRLILNQDFFRSGSFGAAGRALAKDIQPSVGR